MYCKYIFFWKRQGGLFYLENEVLRMLIFQGNLCFCSSEERVQRAKAAAWMSVLQGSSENPADTASSSSLSHIKLVVNVLF